MLVNSVFVTFTSAVYNVSYIGQTEVVYLVSPLVTPL